MGSAQRDELVVERVGEAWVLRLVGDHDLVNEGVLQAEIEAVFARGSVVLVDLSAATFIDSTIMSVFVRGARLADEEPDHAFAVCAPPGTEPRRVLDLVMLM